MYPTILLMAVGITAERVRETLGFVVAASTACSSGNALFSPLQSRGLHGVALVVSDGHRGLMQAIADNFPSAQWQRCPVHWARNVLDRCPRKWQAPLRHAMRDLFHSRNKAAARAAFTEIAEAFGTKAPKAVDLLEERLDEATAVLTLPWKYRLRLRSTNMVERLIEELRRRERSARGPTCARARAYRARISRSKRRQYTLTGTRVRLDALHSAYMQSVRQGTHGRAVSRAPTCACRPSCHVTCGIRFMAS